MTTASDPNALVTFPWLYGTTAEAPRYTAFFLTDQAACACGRNDSVTALLDRIAADLATADQWGAHDVIVVDRDRSPADVYRIEVTLAERGQVVTSERHVMAVPWCCACEEQGHTFRECLDDDDRGDAPETMAESLGLRGFGAR